jgi:hypothetical protein
MLKLLYEHITILLDILKKIKQDHHNSIIFVSLRFIKYNVIIIPIRKAKNSTILFLKKTIFFTIFRLSVKHIYGPKKISYGLNELIVICLVRDGEPYIKSFMEHYFELGVKHIVLLDNNSCDNTIPIARKYEHVTILQTKLPYKRYQFIAKEYLMTRFSRGRWYLCADIDELFDYPFSDVVDLNSLLEYLNKNLYTAVFGQMLDMFSDGPLLSQKSTSDDSIKDLYKFYDISDIQKEDYISSLGNKNIISNENIKIYWGGIRKTIFGSYDWLSKHPLVFLNNKTRIAGDTSHNIYSSHRGFYLCSLSL